MRLLSLCAVLLAACGPVDRPWCNDSPPIPELKTCEGCAPTVRSRLRLPSDEGLDVAFVAEGFTVDQLKDFEGLTEGWLTDFEREVGGQVPGLVPRLNAWWIDFHELAPSDGFVLGTCMRRDEPDRGVRFVANEQRLNALVPQEGIDVFVVVVNSSSRLMETGALPWFSERPVVMANSFTFSDTFAHELGHSLFGLHDEYSEIPGAPAVLEPLGFSDGDLRADDPSVFLAPNVSLSARSPKFGGANAGLPGGAGYEAGVFHQDVECLMNQGTGRLCPICQRTAAQRVDSARVLNPRCGLRVTEEPGGGLGANVYGFSWDGMSEVRVRGRTSHSVAYTGTLGAILYQSLERAPGYPIEATCVDRRGHQSSVRLDL